MIAPILAVTVLVFAAASVALAQRQWLRAPNPPFPAEKFSTRPVQANPPPSDNPTERTQKQRWDERSQIPPAAPK